MQPQDIATLKGLQRRIFANAALSARILRRLSLVLQPYGIRLSFMARRRFWVRGKIDQWLEMASQQERSAKFYENLRKSAISPAQIGALLKVIFLALDEEMADAFTLKEREALSRLAGFLTHAIKEAKSAQHAI